MNEVDKILELLLSEDESNVELGKIVKLLGLL